MIKIDIAEPQMSLCLLYMVPTLPTMQLHHCVTYLEAVYQITSIVLWSHTRLYTTVLWVKLAELPLKL